jgi:hypothetical protein
VIHNRKEVTNLTPQINKTGNQVLNWHISDKSSLSYYRYTFFQEGNTAITQVTFRDPMRTNWESYKDGLRASLEMLQKFHMIQDIDLAAKPSSYPILIIV